MKTIARLNNLQPPETMIASCFVLLFATLTAGASFCQTSANACCDFASQLEVLIAMHQDLGNVGCIDLQGVSVRVSPKFHNNQFTTQSLFVGANNERGVGLDSGFSWQAAKLLDSDEEIELVFSRAVNMQILRVVRFNTDSAAGVNLKFNEIEIKCMGVDDENDLITDEKKKSPGKILKETHDKKKDSQRLKRLIISGELQSNSIDVSAFGAVDRCTVRAVAGPGFAVAGVSFNPVPQRPNSQQKYLHHLYPVKFFSSSSSSSD